MNKRMASVHRSKVDNWLVVVLLIAMAVSLAASLLVLATTPIGTGVWIAVPTVAFGAGLPLWLLLATEYALDGRYLRVRSGPMKWTIALADIERISATRNPLSSPALSLDRLRIDYGKGRFLMISPRDRQAFLAEIEAMREQARS